MLDRFDIFSDPFLVARAQFSSSHSNLKYLAFNGAWWWIIAVHRNEDELAVPQGPTQQRLALLRCTNCAQHLIDMYTIPKCCLIV